MPLVSEVWLPWLSIGLVAVLVARWGSLINRDNARRLTDVVGAALIVLAWHSSLWTRFAQGYSGDTLYNLSLAGRVGLVLLTVLLVVLLISLSLRKSRWLQQLPRTRPGAAFALLAADLLLTLVLFVLAVMLVPQVYYTYYLLLFDFLTQQWVIKPSRLVRLWQSLSMDSNAGSSLHAIGFTGWWLLVLTVLNWLKHLQLASPLWRLVGVTLLLKLAWHWLFDGV